MSKTIPLPRLHTIVTPGLLAVVGHDAGGVVVIPLVACAACRGSGYVSHYSRGGRISAVSACPECDGAGFVEDSLRRNHRLQ